MLIEAAALKKSFSGVPALRSVSIGVAPGEIHALLGENGAGKSTLAKILSGAMQPDEGRIDWKAGSGRRAGMIHQEPMLAPHLTVAENLFLGREKGFLLDHRALRRQAQKFLDDWSLPLDPSVTVRRLNAAQKQILELARALAGDPELLIFDEATSSQSELQSREVMRIAQVMRDRGAAVIYISHRLAEVSQVATRTTILRDGETVFAGHLEGLTHRDLVRHMAGRNVETEFRTGKRTVGEELLRVEGRGLDFSVRSGEIVGIAGLVGSGRSRLCRSLAAQGAFLTEDRQHSGIFPRRPLQENMTISALPLTGPRFAGILSLARERELVSEMTKRMGIRGAPGQRIETLSGGNQQKVLLARLMLRRARVFLLDEPTRGIDVAAKADVFALMNELAREGAAILMVSSEIQELLEMCDRLMVMRAGKITQELDPATASREEVLHWAL